MPPLLRPMSMGRRYDLHMPNFVNILAFTNISDLALLDEVYHKMLVPVFRTVGSPAF
jgi:hypothetical protein